MSEIASVSKISHENLVKLHGGCIDGPFRILVYEYMENNSLARLMQGNKILFLKFLLNNMKYSQTHLKHVYKNINNNSVSYIIYIFGSIMLLIT